MNDRELLELAAKAAGWVVEYDDDEGLSYTIWGDENVPMFDWNPLTDDGDALRLMVKLGLHVFQTKHYVRCGRKTIEMPIEESKREQDEFAATRRAIVRAAAEIGRAKP